LKKSRQISSHFVLNNKKLYGEDFTDLLRRAAAVAEFALSEAARTDAETDFPRETFERVRAEDLLVVCLPKEFGGRGIGLRAGTNRALLHLLKIIGRGNLAVGRVFEGHVNALLLLLLYGKPEQIEKFAADARRGALFGVWNTEGFDGVKIESINNSRFRLAGAKIFASGAGFVTRPFVNAAFADGGWQMCLLSLSAEAAAARTDESWWQPLGMRATRSFRVDFTEIEIECENLIGEPNDYYREPWFSVGAIRFAAVQLGAAESLLELTCQYLRGLNRASDVFQQQRVAEMAIRVKTGNLWLDAAGQNLDRFLSNPTDTQRKKLLTYANLMRTAIEQICVDIMIFCQRSIGARGLMRPLHFERIIRDLTIYLRQPAPDAALIAAGRAVLESDAPLLEILSERF
jgi:alkylation response protein AidB-like acyl-CoA dehydrogenase